MPEKENCLKWGEEEKKSSPRTTTTGEQVAVKPTEGLPKEIENKQYSCEHELHVDLKNLGVDDLCIVLNKQGFAVWQKIPGEAHQCAITEISDLFDECVEPQ